MAAINFPTATSNGQTFTADTGVIYTYIGTPPNGFWSGTFGTTGLATLDGRFVALNDGNSIQTMQTQGLKFNNGTADTILLDGVNGKVGVGTTTVDANLHVKGSYPTVHIERDHATNYSRLLLDNTANDGGAIDGIGDGVGGLRFSTSDAGTITERLRIDSSGRLLVGTTTEGLASSADKLTLANSGDTGLTIRSGSSNYGNVMFSDATSGTGEYIGYIQYYHADNCLKFGTNATERMRIDSSGRLVVGQSSSPSSGSGQYAKIFVAGYAGGTPGGAIISIARDEAATAMSSGDTLGELIFSDNTGGTFASVKGAADGAPGSNDFPGHLTFLTTADGASSQTERMRIDSLGNVGIGGSPSGSATAYNGGLLHISQSTSSRGSQLRLTNNHTGHGAGDGSFIAAWVDSGLYITNQEAGGIHFSAGGSERMRISDSGSVNIGTSSGATNADITLRAAAPQLSLYATPGNVSRITLGDTDDWNIGQLGYDNSDNSMFFTTNNVSRVKIDSSGRLLVGTSSQSQVAKFVVQGQTDDAAQGGYMRLQTNSSVTDGTVLGTIGFGDATNNGANIQSRGSMSWSPFGKGSDLRFSTTSASSTGPDERMRITSSGKVLINTAIASSYTDRLLTVGNTSHTSPTIEIRSATNGFPGLVFSDSTASNVNSYRGAIEYSHSSNHMQIRTNSDVRMVIDSSGRLLVGLSSSTQIASQILQGSSFGASDPGILFLARGTATPAASQTMGSIRFSDNTHTPSAVISAARDGGTWSATSKPTYISFQTVSNGATSGAERMRISHSGDVLIGTTSNFNATDSSNPSGKAFGWIDGRLNLQSSSESIAVKRHGSNGSVIQFARGASGPVGSISVTNSSTAYNTSSDYRLKENVVDLTAAIPRLKTLPVHRFNFITDSEKTVDGFLAHEAQLVVPEAVTGTHNQVDGDGNPVMQSIDQAKLVPLLTAALKEAIGRIETLETEVAALKAG